MAKYYIKGNLYKGVIGSIQELTSNELKFILRFENAATSWIEIKNNIGIDKFNALVQSCEGGHKPYYYAPIFKNKEDLLRFIDLLEREPLIKDKDLNLRCGVTISKDTINKLIELNGTT